MNLLKPFAETAQTRALTLEATIFQPTSDELLVDFVLRGAFESILLPDPSLVASRKDELWKHTCFECFFSSELEETSPYYEVNCAPNGDWNAYGFSSYRQGMHPAEHLKVKLSHRESSKEEALFRLRIWGDDLTQARHLGITAVVEFVDGSRSFFALAHPGPQADFHLKKSFSISL